VSVRVGGSRFKKRKRRSHQGCLGISEREKSNAFIRSVKKKKKKNQGPEKGEHNGHFIPDSQSCHEAPTGSVAPGGLT
jgi:hypothetical protein